MDNLFATTRVEAPAARASLTEDACLVHIYPTGALMGSRYVLHRGPFTLGRMPECDVTIDDYSVSRQHARIELRQDGHHVIDLNSTNGTFVNDVAQPSRKLEDGDYLRIGNCIYRYLAGGNVEAEYHEEIYRLTIIDALTGIRNRRYLMEFIDHELARAGRYGRPLGLILFDLDRFKAVNDEFGHLGGDWTLRELATCVKEVVRKDELFARYGGEEFALLLPEADLAEGVKVAERIRALVEAHVFIFDTKRVPVTVSVGVAVTTSEDRLTADELIRRADEKLYEAKSEGRNCVRG